MRGKTNEGLILFKPHFSVGCEVHQMKRLSASAKRYYFNCPCPFWIQGRLATGEKVPRQTTGVNTLAEAEAMMHAWTSERAQKAASERSHGVLILDCIQTYLAWRASAGIEPITDRTLGQIRYLLNLLQRYCEARNVIHMRGVTVDLLERFKVEGLPGSKSTTKATAWAKLRSFLKAASRRGWISGAVLADLSTHKAIYQQKEPFTDEEIGKILAEAERLNGGTVGYAKHPQTFRLLLELMLKTGLRVSDAVIFDPATLEKGDTMWIYTYYPKKQKRSEEAKSAEAFVSDELVGRIKAGAWLSTSKPFLYRNDPEAIAQAVYERMQEIGRRCGVADCRPHRLRDTFAVRCLAAGMNLEDVSRLLAHSSIKVTEKYYARWVTARKRRLEGLLSQTLMDA